MDEERNKWIVQAASIAYFQQTLDNIIYGITEVDSTVVVESKSFYDRLTNQFPEMQCRVDEYLHSALAWTGSMSDMYGRLLRMEKDLLRDSTVKGGTWKFCREDETTYVLLSGDNLKNLEKLESRALAAYRLVDALLRYAETWSSEALDVLANPGKQEQQGDRERVVVKEVVSPISVDLEHRVEQLESRVDQLEEASDDGAEWQDGCFGCSLDSMDTRVVMDHLREARTSISLDGMNAAADILIVANRLRNDWKKENDPEIYKALGEWSDSLVKVYTDICMGLRRAVGSIECVEDTISGKE